MYVVAAESQLNRCMIIIQIVGKCGQKCKAKTVEYMVYLGGVAFAPSVFMYVDLVLL